MQKNGESLNQAAKTGTILIPNRKLIELSILLIKTYTNVMENEQEKAKGQAFGLWITMLMAVAWLPFYQPEERVNQTKYTSLSKHTGAYKKVPATTNKIRKRNLWMMLEAEDERTLYA